MTSKKTGRRRRKMGFKQIKGKKEEADNMNDQTKFQKILPDHVPSKKHHFEERTF